MQSLDLFLKLSGGLFLGACGKYHIPILTYVLFNMMLK